jgi:hypothetical protein
VKQWNDGKQAEYCRRRPFKITFEEPGVEAAVAMKEDGRCNPPMDQPTEATDPVCTDDALRQMGSV